MDKEHRRKLNALMRSAIIRFNESNILDSLPCMGMMIESDSKEIVYANKKMLDYLGYELKDLMDKSFMNFIPEDKKVETKEVHEGFMLGELEKISYVNHWIAKDGSHKKMIWITQESDYTEFDGYIVAIAVKGGD